MDLYLIHCPSYFDFTKDFFISGSGVAGVPTTSIFEMYPIGLISLAETLQKNNYSVRIINLALKMVKSKKFDLIKFIKKLNAQVIGFDLHWMIHAQGTLKIAELVKKYHPNTPIILGGFTASYFHKEIIKNYSYIDFIIRGDSAEYPLLRLMDCLKFNRNFEKVPNLVWRNGSRLKINKFSYVPNNIDYNGTNFPKIYFKMFLASHDLDLISYLPTLYFLKKPVIPILFSKGCTYNCINCGGSQYANKIINNRYCLAKKPAKEVAKEILNISQGFNFPMRIIGDWRICGKRYYNEIFNYLGNAKIDNPVTFEFFTPAPKNYLKRISKNFERVSIEISPESGSERVRMFQGRPFTNRGIFDMIKNFNLLNEYLFIMWFQTGNALDSEDSLKQTLKFCEKVLDLNPKNIHPFLSPLAPYIDPGSLGFEHPEKYNYKIIRPTLKAQIEGFEQPIWKYYLNYETKYFNVDNIITLTYKYVKLLEEIKFKKGLMSKEAFDESYRLLTILERLTFHTDKIWKTYGRDATNNFLKKMNFDKTGLKIKSKLTPILFPELSKLELIKNLIKFSSYTIRNNFKNII
ncbi:MAG: cobalamin-dependent protein [Candidatus Helarchaeota archaeon]